MSIDNIKYYLKPFGYVSNTNGKILFKKKKAIKVNDCYFLFIEVVKKNKKSLQKEHFSVEEFLNFIKTHQNTRILFERMCSPRKIIKKSHLIFGILNITPDSFSDGGEYFDIKTSYNRAKKLIKDGADFVDIGGESTRPNADVVKPIEEVKRVLPIIQKLDNKEIRMSLDTRNSETMELGILSGVKVINDVSALINDPKSAGIIRKYKVPIILMHMPGNPKTMMSQNNYVDIVLDVYDFLNERIEFCEKNGIKRENIIIDPGIGFGKDSNQNLTLLNNLSIFHSLGCPIMLGVSRKRFISSFTDSKNPKDRLGGTLTATTLALHQGVQVHRVHDVFEIRQAIKIFEEINSI